MPILRELVKFYNFVIINATFQKTHLFPKKA